MSPNLVDLVLGPAVRPALPAPRPAPRAVPRPGPVRLPLVGGGTTLVDVDVAERLGGRSLYRRTNPRGSLYVALYEGGRLIFLHRWITAAPDGHVVHHVNRRSWDNRVANLRILTHSRHRLLEPRRDAASGWLGVWRTRADSRGRNRFQVHVCVNGRKVCPVALRSAYLAAMARDDLAARLTGGQVALNFPRRLPRARLRAWLLRRPGAFVAVFVPRGGGPVRTLKARRPTALELAARPPRGATCCR